MAKGQVLNKKSPVEIRPAFPQLLKPLSIELSTAVFHKPFFSASFFAAKRTTNQKSKMAILRFRFSESRGERISGVFE